LPYSPSFTLSLCSPLPIGAHPGKDLFYPPALHFFKVYIDSPREFHLGASGLYILCFYQINPISLSLSPGSPNIQQFKV
jgi:hypothetical protein